MALLGQAVSQALQSAQSFGLANTHFPFLISNAPVGQTFTHSPHPLHLSGSIFGGILSFPKGGYISCYLISLSFAHLKELLHNPFILFKIPGKLLWIFLKELKSCPLDVGGSYSPHLEF